MVYTFNPLVGPRWREFVGRHAQASVFHTPQWLEAVRRTYGYAPVVYTTCPPTASLTSGIVFCRVSSWLTGRRMVCLPFADHCEPLVEGPEDWNEFSKFLPALIARENCQYVEIRPLRSDLVTGPGLDKGRSFFLHVLDLRPTLEDLFRGFHKDSTQRKIRRADREALGYEQGRSEVLLNKFYRLLLLTRRRHKLPPHPIEWFRNLIACLGDRLTIRVASHQGRPVASILTLSYRETLVYKYGCSDASSHNLGAMQFLFWKAIQEAKEGSFQKFDLGRSDLDNAGLITFKERWGATRSTLTYVRCSARRLRSITDGYGMRLAKEVFARMPDGLLTTAGKLLYRHIG
jgi:hypothetical protein